MVVSETKCPDCRGRIVAVRDLENVVGTAEVEEHHAPGCPAVTQHARDEALHLASQAALYAARRERP